METEPRVYIRHIRQASFCMGGARTWFARQGWSWKSFLDEGKPASEIESTGCPLGLKVAALAREESRGR